MYTINLLKHSLPYQLVLVPTARTGPQAVYAHGLWSLRSSEQKYCSLVLAIWYWMVHVLTSILTALLVRCSCPGGALFLLLCHRQFGHCLQWFFLISSWDLNYKLCNLTCLETWTWETVFTTFYLHGRRLAYVELNGSISHFQKVQSIRKSCATAHTGHPFHVSHYLWQKQTAWGTWFGKKSCLKKKTICSFSLY